MRGLKYYFVSKGACYGCSDGGMMPFPIYVSALLLLKWIRNGDIHTVQYLSSTNNFLFSLVFSGFFPAEKHISAKGVADLFLDNTRCSRS